MKNPVEFELNLGILEDRILHQPEHFAIAGLLALHFHGAFVHFAHSGLYFRLRHVIDERQKPFGVGRIEVVRFGDFLHDLARRLRPVAGRGLVRRRFVGRGWRCRPISLRWRRWRARRRGGRSNLVPTMKLRFQCPQTGSNVFG